MFKILVISGDIGTARELCSRLEADVAAQCFPGSSDDVFESLTARKFDIAFIEVADSTTSPDLISRIKLDKEIPVIAGVPRSLINNFVDSDADDFILAPYNAPELSIRIKRLLNGPVEAETVDLIVCGDLTLDPSRCEVRLSGKEVELAFKEYELLKFLMTKRGRVFSREALLNKVWGDNYFGGDRTVDVHIRRIRSKIEVHNHSFIETVRNIGYRFTKTDGTRNEDVTLP